MLVFAQVVRSAGVHRVRPTEPFAVPLYVWQPTVKMNVQLQIFWKQQESLELQSTHVVLVELVDVLAYHELQLAVHELQFA